MDLLSQVAQFQEEEDLWLVFIFLLISGTPECSYNIQQAEESMLPCSCLPFISILLSFLMIFLLGSPLLFKDVSLTDLWSILYFYSFSV